MNNLAPPKRVRKVNVKNCANCVHRLTDTDGEMYCKRDIEGNPWGDETDIHYTVCDGFEKFSKLI